VAASVSTLLATLALAAGQGHAVHRTTVIGHSVDGRAIHVVETGTPGQPRILAVGCIHGNECAGMAVIRALRRRTPPRHADLWLVPSLNPDGRAAGTRQNARGVDLNRNFSAGWSRHGAPGSTYYSGPRPFSEPETRTARRLIGAIRPKVTIWYHQHMRLVWTSGTSVPAGRLYATMVGLRLYVHASPGGAASRWIRHRFPLLHAFAVELPAGRLSRGGIRRHIAAVLAMAGRETSGRGPGVSPRWPG
jgi:murein peptide amidase A